MLENLGELRVVALRENLRTVAYFVQGIAHRLQLSEETLFELELAVEEATTNIISHAYPDPERRGDIHLLAELVGNAVQITFTDWGVPFDPTRVKPFDMNAPVEDRIQGGMGLHFIHKLMDGVERRMGRHPGDPNRLILIKKVQRGKAARQVRRDSQELSAMQSITEGIASGIELDELLQMIVNKLVETVGAERGTLYLLDEERGELWSKVLLEDVQVLPEIRIKVGESSIAGHVAATGEILNIRDAYTHPLFNPTFDRTTGYHTETILTVPMRNPKHQIIGVVQLLNKVGGAFLRRDERLLSAMAAQAAISIENARLYSQELQQRLLARELDTARNIQQSFLPESVPHLENFDIGAFWKPMHNVAGDFYDFRLLDDGRLAVVIADVSGKGMPAALFMALAVTLLRFGMSLSLSPGELLDRTNRLILSSQRSRLFATIFVGYLDLNTREMQYASAGHNPPILYRAEGQACEMLNASGVAVGVFQDAKFDEALVRLAENDVLVLYTDGITEIINADEEDFGEDRLSELISENAHLPAQALTEHVIQSVNTFAGAAGDFDDETLVIIRCCAPPVP